MTLLPGVKTLMRLQRVPLGAFRLLCTISPAKVTSICLPRQLCTNAASGTESKPASDPENESLLESLTFMGVDVKMVRERQPGVLRKVVTNEQGLAKFLKSKGSSDKVIAGIISRFPRAITRSGDHLEQRWELWRSVFQSDAEIISILDRSPESFFRSSDNDNLGKNILFLSSLGLTSKHLHRLLTSAPRTFSNSVALNMQMVEFLGDVCEELGGDDPRKFAKDVICRNLYVLIRSTRRVHANIEMLKSLLDLSDSEMLDFLQGSGAQILDLSNEYLRNNFMNLQQKLWSCGCREDQFKGMIVSQPSMLYIGPENLISKIDCLLKGGISLKQILEKPRVLEFSKQNITERLEELHKIGYDFEKSGIGVLNCSRKRFDAKLQRLPSAQK
ncbi:transcription termination factor 1a, mitochondrial [Osmerus eperlanus]|uniref:transcription termination factor 1a, mitochondrial n=1 Tax=Osmerus eperlanus TaxID=29151 RepID=UPI002E114A00